MDNQIYQAPKSTLVAEEASQANELATRGSRFLAALIDGLIAMVFTIPFMFFLGPFFGYELGQTTQPSTVYLIVSTIFGLGVLLLVHGYLLHANGQTVGKKVLGIRIVSLNNTLVPLPKLIGLRYLPLSLVAFIPFIGQFLPLADILFIFRKDKRCVHDLIAGTRVVKCELK